jgi:3-hydroxyisobutyrate dehydrogenase
MSSSEPTGTRQLAADLKALGVTLVDGPVSGGVIGAEEGKLTIMIGCDDPATIERVTPVLKAIGPRHYHTGGAGTGHAMKCLNNIMSGAGVILMTEALILGQKFGLDPGTLVVVINESTGRSHATLNLGRQEIISRNFGSKFRLGLLVKDVGIAADLSEDLKAHTPLVRLIRDLWQRVNATVGPDEDHTCCVRYWEGLNDITIGVPDAGKGSGS